MQTHPARKPFVALFLALAIAGLGGGCTPSGPRALLQGADLIRKGKYEAAITKLKIATELIRGDARAWNYLGLAYHGAGQFGEAIIAYQRAQQIDKNLAEARFNLGELYLEQGNPVSAADEFAIYTALQPKSVEGWLQLADAHMENQRYDRAQTSYYYALNLKRETPEAWNGLGLILLQRKDPRNAYRYFVEAYKYDANYTPAILNMAVVAQTYLNAQPTALKKYQEYLEKAPDAPNISAVKAAIQHLDQVVNPRPVVQERKVEVATEEKSRSPAPNTSTPTAHPVETTAAQVTNTPAAAESTNRHVATNVRPPHSVTREKPPATVATDTSSHVVATPTAPTNKPPVQLAKAETKPLKPPPAIRTPEKTESKGPETTPEKPVVKQEEPAPAKVESAKPTIAPPEPKLVDKSPEPTKESSKAVEELPLEEARLEASPVQTGAEISPPPQDIQPAAHAGALQKENTSESTVTPPTDGNLAKTENAVIPRVETIPPKRDEKRGFFQRLNPLNLFHSRKAETPEKKPAEIVTPLPPDTNASTPPEQEPAPVPPVTKLARTEPDPVTPLPPSTSVPRYEYGRIKKPVPGDRAAAERLFARGVNAQTVRDPAGAATFFAAAAEADPTYFAAHYNLGLVAYSEGQFFKALSAFETALVLEPHSVDARYNFALTLQRADFPVDSARELEKLLEEKPDDTRAHLLLGNVYAQKLHDAAAAKIQYQKVLALDPQHPQATAIRYWLVQHP